jgi:hypothetical protein
MVMVWLQNVTLLQVSEACQVLLTLLRVGQRGLAALVTVLTTVMKTFVPEQTSTAVGAVNAKGVPHWTIWSGAQTRSGGSVSTTVMFCVQKEALLQVSVAFQTRVMVNKVGQRGLAALVVVLTVLMVTLVPSQISTAVGAVKARGLPHSTIWFSAQVMVGGVVSTTVRV